jgi:hypothetical protein
MNKGKQAKLLKGDPEDSWGERMWEYNGIIYKTKCGFMQSVLIKNKWHNVLNYSGVSKAVRLIHQGAKPSKVYETILKEGNKI